MENKDVQSDAQQPVEVAAKESTQPESIQTGCTGNCKNCSTYQRTFCAAQIGFNTQTLVASLIAKISELQDAIFKLSSSLHEAPQLIEPGCVNATFEDDNGIAKESERKKKKSAK